MTYLEMTTRQLEQEQATQQGKVRNASPSAYWQELAQLGRLQSVLTYRYQQNEKDPVRQAERATSRR